MAKRGVDTQGHCSCQGQGQGTIKMCLTGPSGSRRREILTNGPNTLPVTPQERRQLLQTAQAAKIWMSIEKYLLKTDPYRCSTSNARFPLPLTLNRTDPSLTQQLQEDKGLRSLILYFLTKYGLLEPDFDFYNVSKPAYPNGGDVQVPMLIINVDVGDEVSTTGWQPVSLFLHNLLCQRGYRGVCVEIQDRNRYFQPSLFPLSPGDSAVKSYEAVRKVLIEIIRKELPHSWSMMSIFKVGRDSTQAMPMIVVMVQPLAKQNWWEMKKQMGKITRLGIEFVIGSCQPLTPPVASCNQPGRQLTAGLTPWPKLGCSIGVEGEQGAGTLGGFVTLSCGGKDHRGILTCAHVVEPPSSARVSIKQKADREGTRYEDKASEPTKTKVRYFAQKDIEVTKDLVQTRTSFLRERIGELTHSETMRTTMMGDEPRAKDRIEILKLELAEFESMLPTLERMPISIGRVLISSGKAISATKSSLDWAFVEVDSKSKEIFDNPDKNLLPLPKSSGIYGKNASSYDKGLENYLAIGGRNQVHGFSEVRKGHWYFKVGRTTDVTTGICHGTEVYCNLIGIKHRTRYDETKMRPTLERVDYTEELVIMNRQSGQAVHEQSDFCQSGDSGAWLIDVNHCVAGLLFGSMTGLCGPPNKDQPRTGTYVNAGLVTSMTEVQKSIAAWTTPRDSNGAPTGSPGVLSLPQSSLET